MTLSLIAVTVAFVLAFASIWAFRRTQLRHLHQQAHYMHLFSRQVSAFREREDIPENVMEFVETLVRDPVDGGIIRYAIWHFRQRDATPPRWDGETMALRQSVNTLSAEAQEALQNIVVTYIKAQSHADLVAGYIFRNMLLRNLQRETQAGVAVDTIAQSRAVCLGVA